MTRRSLRRGAYSTFPIVQYPSARKTTDYGLSAFDHGNRLVFSYMYELPKWETAPPRGEADGEWVAGVRGDAVSEREPGECTDRVRLERGWDRQRQAPGCECEGSAGDVCGARR